MWQKKVYVLLGFRLIYCVYIISATDFILRVGMIYAFSLLYPKVPF